VDAKLQSNSTSAGGGITFGWDQLSERTLSSAVSAGVSFTWYDTTQQLADFATRAGQTINAAQLTQACASTHLCSRALQNLLAAQQAQLGQLRFSAGLTETIARDQDVGLTLAYYVYTADPTQIGSFSVATRGRTGAAPLREYDFGQGISIAPTWWSARLDLARRFRHDAVQAGIGLTFAEYVDDPSGASQGYELDLGLKLSWSITRRWRVWLALTGERIVASTAAVSYLGTGALGVRCRF
jgi:hypothetical protein